jgi:type II secretory pathway component PulF
LLTAFVLLLGGFVFISIRWPLRSTGLASYLPDVFGRATALARLSQFIADLLEAGLSVPDTLCVAGFLTNRKRLREAAWRLADQLQLNVSAARHVNAPPAATTIFYALRSEMPTASRVRLLREISQAHADRARIRLSWTRGFIEPITILIVGFLVAGLVVALFLPLIKLVDGLSH